MGFHGLLGNDFKNVNSWSETIRFEYRIIDTDNLFVYLFTWFYSSDLENANFRSENYDQNIGKLIVTLTEKNYRADNSYYSDLGVTIYGR